MNSINTALFATRSENVHTKKRPTANEKHIIGLDMGYSGPKCVHENGHFAFPNFCQKITGDIICALDKDDIVYENLISGNRYCVGNMAINMLNDETAVSEDNMLDRNHYIHPEFKVKLETSLGLALWDQTTDGSDVFVQTGLPPAYLVKDRPLLINAIKGRHYFKLTVGKETKEFDINILTENIDVMIQPMGTLNSLMFDDDANLQPIAKDISKSDLLIFDAGFGTLDTFYICSKQLQAKDTNPDLGMKRILTETKKLIKKELGEDPSITSMQKILKNGMISVNDLLTVSTEYRPIDGYLKTAVEKVGEEAFESIKGYIFNIKFLVMSGGTSEVWVDDFKKKLLRTSISVIKGSTGSNLPNIYSNARGYYYYRLRQERKSSVTHH